MNKSVVLLLFLLLGCTTKKIVPPGQTKLTVRMAVEGADKFENYIHSLTIYAFRRTAGGRYVYDKTLAVLDKEDIASLAGSAQENTKIFQMNLTVGYYQLFFVGNANGKITGALTSGTTLPEDLLIPGKTDGEENIYFLGNVKTQIVSDFMSPIPVTLSRAVGKLIVVLKQLPSQLDSVSMEIDNISGHIGIGGTLSGPALKVRKSWKLSGTDTAVFQMLTLPTLGDSSPYRLRFTTETGQHKTKEMPALLFLPDKYIRVTATIDDRPGAFLSFDIMVFYRIYDFWEDLNLPDIPLIPEA